MLFVVPPLPRTFVVIASSAVFLQYYLVPLSYLVCDAKSLKPARTSVNNPILHLIWPGLIFRYRPRMA